METRSNPSPYGIEPYDCLTKLKNVELTSETDGIYLHTQLHG
jgi:hypothetical protein